MLSASVVALPFGVAGHLFPHIVERPGVYPRESRPTQDDDADVFTPSINALVYSILIESAMLCNIAGRGSDELDDHHRSRPRA